MVGSRDDRIVVARRSRRLRLGSGNESINAAILSLPIVRSVAGCCGGTYAHTPMFLQTCRFGIRCARFESSARDGSPAKL